MPDRPRATSWPLSRSVPARERLAWAMALPLAAAAPWALGLDVAGAVALAAAAAAGAWTVVRQRAPAAGPRARVGQREAVHRAAADMLAECARRDRSTAVLLLRVETGDAGARPRALDLALRRIRATMRRQDVAMRYADDVVAVVLAPSRRADLGAVMSIVDRLQAAIGAPMSIGGRSVRAVSSVGICTQAASAARTGAEMVAVAEAALAAARAQGAGSVRADPPAPRGAEAAPRSLAGEVEGALAAGQIAPCLEPRIDVRTGRVAGVGARARWLHPSLGLLPSGRSGSAVSGSGLAAEVSEAVLDAALDALVRWDTAGCRVPSASIALCPALLADPRLADRIAWQIDRREVDAARVVVAIPASAVPSLETEAARRTLRALRDAGHPIALVEVPATARAALGTAPPCPTEIVLAAAAIRGIDGDAPRLEALATLVREADRAGLSVGADGVETQGERDTLRGIGCAALAGPAIAATMSPGQAVAWRPPPIDGDPGARAGAAPGRAP